MLRFAGYEPVAQAAAWYLMNADTGPTVFGVYGRWGSGKSSFMRLMEREMLLCAAEDEISRWGATQQQVTGACGIPAVHKCCREFSAGCVHFGSTAE
jgi:hypothetical protein